MEYKEGVDKYLSQIDKKKMIEGNLNNMIYYNSLLDIQELAENVLWDDNQPLFRVTACVTGKAELTKEKVVKI